jgi:hypothetical protein
MVRKWQRLRSVFDASYVTALQHAYLPFTLPSHFAFCEHLGKHSDYKEACYVQSQPSPIIWNITVVVNKVFRFTVFKHVRFIYFIVYLKMHNWYKTSTHQMDAYLLSPHYLREFPWSQGFDLPLTLLQYTLSMQRVLYLEKKIATSDQWDTACVGI